MNAAPLDDPWALDHHLAGRITTALAIIAQAVGALEGVAPQEDRGASLGYEAASERENRSAPERRANAAPGLDLPLAPSTQGGPVMHSVSRPDDNTRQDPPDDAIPRLQKLLADALKARELVFTRYLEIEARKADVHWYVADENDLYCRACNLPRVNRRHAERPDMVA